jgi:hypothetical protein
VRRKGKEGEGKREGRERKERKGKIGREEG